MNNFEEILENHKRKRKWQKIKDKCMAIDLFSKLLDGEGIEKSLSYTFDEYQIPSMDWAG